MSDLFNLEVQRCRLQQRHRQHLDEPTLPSLATIQAAERSLPDAASASYLAGQPSEEVARHIVEDIVPGLCGQARSSRYFGFVTGGVLPLAEWADNVVSRMDQNVQVHLPSQTVSTRVEAAALEMLVSLLRLGEAWEGRTFTTGATASNVLGLACGREAMLARKGAHSVGEVGLLAACAQAGVTQVQVLASAAHSSLYKAASVVGLGRLAVRDLGREGQPWKLHLDAVERELARPGVASIIAVTAGEVNTGRDALDDVSEWKRLRQLADRHGAWIHLDGAFGIFTRALADRDEYRRLHARADGFVFADSITIDGHKILNLPYDCGMFLIRDASLLPAVFANTNAAYLPPSGPLNMGIENSRRFRALPAYAVLLSEGRPGIASLLDDMVRFARLLAGFLLASSDYELLPNEDLQDIFIIVLFRAKRAELNEVLVDRINETRQAYVSGTSWAGRKAVRVAASSWRIDPGRDFEVVAGILNQIAM